MPPKAQPVAIPGRGTLLNVWRMHITWHLPHAVNMSPAHEKEGGGQEL